MGNIPHLRFDITFLKHFLMENGKYIISGIRTYSSHIYRTTFVINNVIAVIN
jgi:hypothetical protein